MKKIYEPFDLRVKKPIDKRFSVINLSDIDRPYEGLKVFQQSDNKFYDFINNQFIESNKSLNDAINLKVNKTDLPIKDVKKYGVIGDGVANDTTAIQTVLNLGGNIYFPSGTYLVDGLTLSANTTIIGDGDSSIIKLNNSKNTHVLQGSNINNIKISQIKIDGNRTNQTTGNGIHLVTLNNIILQNVTFTNIKVNGIEFYNNVTNGIIEDCRVSYCGGCGFHSTLGVNTINIRGGDYSYCDLSGILLINANGSIIEGVKVHHNTTGGETSNGLSIQSNDVVIKGCELHDNSNAGIYTTNDNISIVGNSSHHNLLGCDLYNGSRLRSNFVVMGNHFSYNTSKGHSAYWAEKITCVGNIIDNNGNGTVPDPGVDYDSCTKVTFSDNILYFNKTYGISIRSTLGTHISDSILIKDNDLNQNLTSAYYVDSSTSNYITIKDNYGYPTNVPMTSPSIPTSGSSVTNTSHRNVDVYIFSGTVTSVSINGSSTGIVTGRFTLKPAETIGLTYSVAPTWYWFIQ